MNATAHTPFQGLLVDSIAIIVKGTATIYSSRLSGLLFFCILVFLTILSVLLWMFGYPLIVCLSAFGFEGGVILSSGVILSLYFVFVLSVFGDVHSS